MSVSEAQAELLGMHAGDGTLYQTQSSVVWELRGGLDEKKWYDSYVVALVKRATGVSVRPKYRAGGKNGCYGIQSCDKAIRALLVSAGFSSGNKCRTVQVPGIVVKSSESIQCAFLRGLFATDGSAYLARINGKETPTYPMIELCSISKKLRDEAYALLKELGIAGTIWTYSSKKDAHPAYFLRLAGKRKTKAFCELVGLSNPKHGQRLHRVQEHLKTDSSHESDVPRSHSLVLRRLG